MGTLPSTGFSQLLVKASRIMAQVTGILPAAGRSEKGTQNHPIHPLTAPMLEFPQAEED